MTAILQYSNSDDLHDSAYQTRFPTPISDGVQKQLSGNTFEPPDRLSQTIAIHQRPPEQVPRTSNIVQSVCSMFSAILEIPVGEIEPTASLDDLGIDSLLATEVLAEIQTRFATDLTQAHFMACTDVLSVAR